MPYKNFPLMVCSQCDIRFQAAKLGQVCCSISCANKLKWSDGGYKQRTVARREETKRKLYAEGKLHGSLKGKKFSPEHIARMKVGMKGRIPWNKGIPRTQEIKEMLSRVHKGKTISQEVRLKTSKTMTRVAKERNFARHFPPLTTEAREQRARDLAKIAKERNFVKHFSVGRTVSPNKAEQQFQSLCEKHKLPFKFTGNHSFWIGNINPDFIEVNGHKIAVDIFGDYWHTPLFLGQAIKPYGTESGRKTIAKEYGWSLVIIWQSEFTLPDAEQRILEKLRRVGVKI